ncbi:hypothetical protein [Burkholderia cepacia]|uniref:hypothetical protein n=1 Tax=Burkholderia cepacia TaxID=292 RepID=UPI002AB612BF|nr:hypothetical protein [Burkholderia cepacia]
MRFRLLSTLVLLAVVAGLYLYTTRDGDRQPDAAAGAAATSQPARAAPTDDADSMKNLKVD